MLPEKAKGNARIMDQREMKNVLDYGNGLMKRKGSEGEGFGSLVKQYDQKNQTVKTAQERRFFFSSSS